MFNQWNQLANFIKSTVITIILMHVIILAKDYHRIATGFDQHLPQSWQI